MNVCVATVLLFDKLDAVLGCLFRRYFVSWGPYECFPFGGSSFALHFADKVYLRCCAIGHAPPTLILTRFLNTHPLFPNFVPTGAVYAQFGSNISTDGDTMFTYNSAFGDGVRMSAHRALFDIRCIRLLQYLVVLCCRKVTS